MTLESRITIISDLMNYNINANMIIAAKNLVFNQQKKDMLAFTQGKNLINVIMINASKNSIK